MNRRNALDIAKATGGEAAASPEHRRFKTLMARIDKARERLQAWHDELPRLAEVHDERVAPLERRLHEARRAWALEIEQVLLAGRWSKAERETLARMVVEITGALLESDAGADDAEMKSLHDRHAEIGFDDAAAQDLAEMRHMVQAATGVDLGDEPIDSVDEMFARAHAKMRERAQQQAGTSGEADGPDASPWPQARRPHKGRQGRPGPSAAERRAAADTERATQSVREVYRKLASALHPDRTPAAAGTEQRQQRTAQMARANAAYEAGDLLALLALQLEIEQIDVARAASVAAEQVRHINRLLGEQLQEIERDIAEREAAFCVTYGVVPDRRPDPQRLGEWLRSEVRELQAAEAQLELERRVLRRAPAEVKRYLKAERERQRAADRFEGLFPI
jgi:hypothetical protein